jgi:Pyridine nucleotide-disulphide oxidoreductase, dimerisation domain
MCMRQTTAERDRLRQADEGTVEWWAWGPYLSERAWGRVRKDYSEAGQAWEFFPHDHACSRVYRWNEDGMAGVCDLGQRFCLALALWNSVDPILKERMFGLTGPQGNHGEDVKEYCEHAVVPRVTFTDPEIGAVSLTEDAARAAGLDLRAGTAAASTTSRGFVHGPGNLGLIKVVVG